MCCLGLTFCKSPNTTLDSRVEKTFTEEGWGPECFTISFHSLLYLSFSFQRVDKNMSITLSFEVVMMVVDFANLALLPFIICSSVIFFSLTLCGMVPVFVCWD